MTRLHLPDTKSQLSFDDTETLGSSERLSEDYVSSAITGWGHELLCQHDMIIMNNYLNNFISPWFWDLVL